MSKYDDQYYIVLRNYNAPQLYLKSIKKSTKRGYSYRKLELGGEPLFFENAYKEDDLKNNVIHELSNVHFNIDF